MTVLAKIRISNNVSQFSISPFTAHLFPHLGISLLLLLFESFILSNDALLLTLDFVGLRDQYHQVLVTLCQLCDLILTPFVLYLFRDRLLIKHLNLFLKTAIDLV